MTTTYQRENATPYALGILCSKLAYATKREAKAALRSCKAMAAAGCTGRREDHIYRCGCGSWHLTSHPNYDWIGAGA